MGFVLRHCGLGYDLDMDFGFLLLASAAVACVMVAYRFWSWWVTPLPIHRPRGYYAFTKPDDLATAMHFNCGTEISSWFSPREARRQRRAERLLPPVSDDDAARRADAVRDVFRIFHGHRR